MSTQIRVALVLLLAVHGVAHLPGFLVAWRLQEFPRLPYTTTTLGGTVDIGPAGIRVLGVLWLVVAIASAVAAGAVSLRTGWAQPFVWIVLTTSAVLCVLGWPATRLGLVANLVIAALVLVAARIGGFTSNP